MDDPMKYFRRIKIRKINDMITCKLCRGYFIDPTTVTECLHTFCKSCVVRRLETSNKCPACDEIVHNTRPLDFIRHDRTMQDLVNKVVPNLEENEYKREVKYYNDKGLKCPKEEHKRKKEEKDKEEKRLEQEEARATTEADNFTLEDYHRYDEQLDILLELKIDGENSNLKTITLLKKKIFEGKSQKYLRCSSLATVASLKTFIVNQCLKSMEDFKDVDIYCNNILINKDHQLKYVHVSNWTTKHLPMHLQFVPKESCTKLKPPDSKDNLSPDDTNEEHMETGHNEGDGKDAYANSQNNNSSSNSEGSTTDKPHKISNKTNATSPTSDTSSMDSESGGSSPEHRTSSEETPDYNNNSNTSEKTYKDLKIDKAILT